VPPNWTEGLFFSDACEALDTEKGMCMTISTKAVAKMATECTQAWNSKSAEAVASLCAEDGEIIINRGEPWTGRSRVADMASGFYADVPDLSLVCDEVRCAGAHVIYVWTFTGHDAKTGNPLKIRGWEEWDIGEDLKVKASRGWFDADDYARQVAGA
jgi:uncharacterized protein (TIGR02246 family)